MFKTNETLFQLIDSENRLFEFLLRIANLHGTTIRVAGGWVRDKVLGLESNDIDITVDNMSGKSFCELCAKHFPDKLKISVIDINQNKSKHIETARVNIFGFDLDFCSLRKEIYSETSNTEIGTPEEDAFNRDLTINSLFYNINTGLIEDYTGGLNDLKNKLANTPVDASITFNNDPLRILRVVRLCVKYGLKISDNIIEVVNNKNIQNSFKSKISKERVFSELFGYETNRCFKQGILSKYPHTGLFILKEFGFIDVLFSPANIELNSWSSCQNSKYHDLNIIDHTLKSIEHLEKFYCDIPPKEMGVIALALMCHDLGKRDPNFIQVKSDGTYSYLGHDDRSVELADVVLDQIGCFTSIKERILSLVRHHMRFHALTDSSTDKALRRIVADIGEDWKLLLIHSECDSCGKISVNITDMINRHDNFRDRILTCLSKQNNQVKVSRPINGFDLMRLGIEPGIRMGNIFKLLDDELLERPGMIYDEAIEFVNELVKNNMA